MTTHQMATETQAYYRAHF